jgi:hypothetical protein
MIHLDLVGELLARGRRGPDLTTLDAAVGWNEPGLAAALRLGASLRMFGLRAVVDTQARGLEEARGWSRELGARHLVHAGDELMVVDEGDGRPRRLRPEQVVARIAGTRFE